MKNCRLGNKPLFRRKKTENINIYTQLSYCCKRVFIMESTRTLYPSGILSGISVDFSQRLMIYAIAQNKVVLEIIDHFISVL